MRIAAWLAVVACAALLTACGEDESSGPEPGIETSAERGNSESEPAAEEGKGESEPADGRPAGTAVVTGESEFGEMLFDERDQAIYIFERDPKSESACYGECAEAWPPVLTEGAPRAGGGAEADLLGTTERRDGTTQVTYAGQPLYFYAHEAPGEVRCHNVNLNGGFWWVVGPDGERLA